MTELPGRVLDELEENALGVGRGRHRPDRRFDDGADLHGLEIELKLARDDPRHVEQLVDDLVLRAGVPNDRVDGGSDLVGSELTALEQVGPPDDRGQWRPQLVRQRGQELVLHPAGRLGHRARLLRLAVEVRVVDGNGRVGREAGDQAFVALVEGPRVRMSEEEAAQQVADAGAHGRREIAPCGQKAGRHPLEREVLVKARVACEVIAARDGALEGRSEGVGILSQGEVDEGPRRRARDTVGPDAGRVPVQEGPERGARDRDASVGHSLDQPFQIEVASQRQPQPVEGRDLRLKLLAVVAAPWTSARLPGARPVLRPASVASRAEPGDEEVDQAAFDEEEAETEGVPA